MMTSFNWEELLKTFGGQAILLAAVGYLIKTLVSNRFERDAEQFKHELKRTSDIEIERLKNALQMAAIEHQVRFSKLHEQRVEIIGKLSRMIQETPAIVGSLVLGNPNDAEKLAAARTCTLDLFRYVQVNSVVLPVDLCKELDQYAENLSRMVTFIDVYWGRIDFPTPEIRAKQSEILLQAASALESEIPKIRNKLIEDLRKLLAGGSD